jgi:hypothetical protein
VGLKLDDVSILDVSSMVSDSLLKGVIQGFNQDRLSFSV